jgi:hypothetical protein
MAMRRWHRDDAMVRWCSSEILRHGEAANPSMGKFIEVPARLQLPLSVYIDLYLRYKSSS